MYSAVALSSPPPTLTFADQYAFRPSGSTTAALVALLCRLRNDLYCVEWDVKL